LLPIEFRQESPNSKSNSNEQSPNFPSYSFSATHDQDQQRSFMGKSFNVWFLLIGGLLSFFSFKTTT
jgi:hypothetical protein